MFCEQCGAQIPESSKFCISCGSAIAQVRAVAQTTAVSASHSSTAQAVRMSPTPQVEVKSTASSETKQPSSGVSRKTAAWFVWGCFFVAVLFIVVAVVNSHSGQNADRSFLRQMATAPLIRTFTLSLPQANFTIPAGRYQYFTFNVPARCSNVHIDGSFEATGGSGNDIEVYVFDGDGFTDWTNRQQAQTYYNSGRQSTDTLKLQLRPTADTPATYYLVFNNRFSFLSNKKISSDIKLHYDRVL